MTVKITLEFPNADAAIVALAKLSKADGVAITPEGKTRKGRADKGVPRNTSAPAPDPKAAGPGSPASSTSAPGASGAPAGDPAPVTTSTASTSTAAGPAASSGPVPSEAEVQKAIEKVFESSPESGTGIQKVKDLLAQFGVSRGRDLKEEQRADFIQKAEASLPKAA